MNQKILKCIPSLLASGAVAQAANMVNVVKASFDVSQEYKDTVCNLPQHFITHMLDLYKDAMYSISECAMVGSDKDMAIMEAEKAFIEKSEKTTKVLDNKANMLSALRNSLSAEYDKVCIQNKPTVLEKSIEKFETTAATNDTINKMVEYVKLLKPEERLAMIYALGIANYVDSSITTASTNEISSEELSEQINSEEKFGIYSINEIEDKTKENMLSHKFNCDDIEYDVLYTVVEAIGGKTIIEICDEIKSKLGIDSEMEIANIDELLDYLDNAGEKITSKLKVPAHVLFIIKDDNVCMICAFSKENVNTLVNSKNTTASSDEEEKVFNLLQQLTDDDSNYIGTPVFNGVISWLKTFRDNVPNSIINDAITSLTKIRDTMDIDVNGTNIDLDSRLVDAASKKLRITHEQFIDGIKDKKNTEHFNVAVHNTLNGRLWDAAIDQDVLLACLLVVLDLEEFVTDPKEFRKVIKLLKQYPNEKSSSTSSTAGLDEDAEEYKDLFFNIVTIEKLREIAVDQEVEEDVDFSSKDSAANDVWDLVFGFDYKNNQAEFINLIRDYDIVNSKNTTASEQQSEPDCSKTFNEICNNIAKLLKDTYKSGVSLEI